MFIKFTCSRSEFKSWISLLIFCHIDLSNIDIEVSHYYCVGVLSLFISLMCLGVPVLGAKYLGSLALLVALILLLLCNDLLCLF